MDHSACEGFAKSFLILDLSHSHYGTGNWSANISTHHHWNGIPVVREIEWFCFPLVKGSNRGHGIETYLTSIILAPTNPTMIEVIVEELCIKTVAKIPNIKPESKVFQSQLSQNLTFKNHIWLTDNWIA